MDKIYVLVCYSSGEVRDIQAFDFEDSDLAYDTKDDYIKHADFDSVELFLVPKHLTKV